LYIGVRALASGHNPYAVVANSLPFPFLYPLPSLLVFAPLAALSEAAARVAWAACQGGVLAWAAARHRPVLLISFLSASYLDALLLGQWSPLFTAAALVPVLGFVWAAKPSLGGILFAAYPSRTAALGALALTGLSLLVMPRWPLFWIEAIRQQIYTPAVLRPGGVLLLLSLVRWRHPEARLLLGFSLVPISTGLYESLPLFLVPRRRRHAYILALLTLITAFTVPLLSPWRVEQGEPLVEHLNSRWPITFTLIYLPVLIMVLRLPRDPTSQESAGQEPRRSGTATSVTDQGPRSQKVDEMT
jgi:hypothetical protein